MGVPLIHKIQNTNTNFVGGAKKKSTNKQQIQTHKCEYKK